MPETNESLDRDTAINLLAFPIYLAGFVWLVVAGWWGDTGWRHV